MVAAATIFPPQALDRMAWPSCPPKYGGVFFRFCLGCAIASIGRPNLLDMSVPKNTSGTVTATVPDTNHLRPLRQASGGRADPGGAWPKPGKAAHPRPSWLRKSAGKPCVRGFLRPSCRRPYGAQPPNRPVIQSQTRAKKPGVSSVSASGSGVGAGETFGV